MLIEFPRLIFLPFAVLEKKYWLEKIKTETHSYIMIFSPNT